VAEKARGAGAADGGGKAQCVASGIFLCGLLGPGANPRRDDLQQARRRSRLNVAASEDEGEEAEGAEMKTRARDIATHEVRGWTAYALPRAKIVFARPAADIPLPEFHRETDKMPKAEKKQKKPKKPIEPCAHDKARQEQDDHAAAHGAVVGSHTGAQR
jgi:hypothetical protein